MGRGSSATAWPPWSRAARRHGRHDLCREIGVMRDEGYSTLVFVVAAASIVLGFSPKFGALIQTIRRQSGRVSIVVFGLIAVRCRIWVTTRWISRTTEPDRRGGHAGAGRGRFTLKSAVCNGRIGTRLRRDPALRTARWRRTQHQRSRGRLSAPVGAGDQAGYQDRAGARSRRSGPSGAASAFSCGAARAGRAAVGAERTIAMSRSRCSTGAPELLLEGRRSSC